MAPLVAVSAHWSLFEFSQQGHDMMMNDDILLHNKLLHFEKYLLPRVSFARG